MQITILSTAVQRKFLGLITWENSVCLTTFDVKVFSYFLIISQVEGSDWLTITGILSLL